MASLPIFQIDAFTDQLFAGNPAAVVPLVQWLDDQTLQNIAMENNLSETAFLVKLADQSQADFHLRWFTPAVEVRLCGHATLASAHWYFSEANPAATQVRFQTLSGILTVERKGQAMVMSLTAEQLRPVEVSAEYLAMLGLKPEQVEYTGMAVEYLQVVVNSEPLVQSLKPDFAALKHSEYGSVIVTAQAIEKHYDFIGRFFAPAFAIDEDPVTGSAFAVMAPYWMERLDLERVVGYQASARGGVVDCLRAGERVLLTGTAVTYLKGEIYLR
ncbi:PhzF family phenazine biosynthesis protein [Oceanobacter mangrovi]|uniref:PhzF family phenazine biosynthesis protein n=1 Tax=Oceanobacter mangrovi TaxID=2862510 RepID=UPI001C8E23BD|nr:PhzF family phenazine biosynthesis protein [Oceanobacter mangrovi]